MSQSIDWLTYAACLRLAAAPISSEKVIRKDQHTLVALRPGGFLFRRAARSYQFSPGRTATAASRTDTVRVPEGTYLWIETPAPAMYGSVHGFDTQRAERVIDGYSGAIDLAFPGIVVEVFYEGSIDGAGGGATVDGTKFLKGGIGASSEQIVSAVLVSAAHVASLSSVEQGRFCLMARWHRRAKAATDDVDSFLYFFTVLEIATPTAEVPNAIAALLATYVGTEERTVKREMELGRITGLRGAIIHRGERNVAESDYAKFLDLLIRIETCADLVLRATARLPYDGRLDPFLRGERRFHR
jgi:hypothetical protein